MFRKLLITLGLAVGLAAGPKSTDLVVTVQPPRPPVERRPVAPGPGYVWTSGYYRWTGQKYVWAQGQWQRPPSPHDTWIGYRWVRRGKGWTLVGGRWR